MTSFRNLARNRDFTVLWLGETVNELGSRMSMFVFPLLAYAITGSAANAAVAEFAFLLGNAVALLPGGILADRVDRRLVMLTASASGLVLYGVLALAVAGGWATLPLISSVGLLTGLGAGAFEPAQMSAIRAVVSEEELPTALSQNQARQHVAGLVGGPLGGALFGLFRWLPFAVDAVTFAISCLSLSRIRTSLKPEPRVVPSERVRDDLARGFAFIWARSFFRVLLVWAASANIVINALFFVVVLRLMQAGFHPAEIGLVETAAGLGGLTGAMLAPYLIDRLPTGWLTIGVSWAFTPLLVPLVLWTHPLVAAVALFLGLLLNPAGNAGIGAYRMAITPPELQGRVASASQFLAMAGMPLSPLLGGWLLQEYGGPQATVVLAVLTALVALLPTCSRAIRSVPRPRDWPKLEVAESAESAAAAA